LPKILTPGIPLTLFTSKAGKLPCRRRYPYLHAQAAKSLGPDYTLAGKRGKQETPGLILNHTNRCNCLFSLCRDVRHLKRDTS